VSSSAKSQLLNDIKARLKGISGSAVSAKTQGSAVDNLYEVWIWSLVVRAANGLPNVSVVMKDLNAHNELVFRASPGEVKTKGFSYAVIENNGVPSLEAHISAYLEGHSSVSHEADVLVIEDRVGQDCRALRSPRPGPTEIVAVIEAKHVGTTTATLALGYGRGLLGLGREITPTELLGLVSNCDSANITTLIGSDFFPKTWPKASAQLEARLKADLANAV
jgi:hypothetical protein